MPAKPSVITSICGTGPLMALDLATVPAATMLPLVQVAMRVADEWNSANIATEYLGAEQALEELASASDAINKLLIPVVPGVPYTTRGDLMDQDSYPVIREGQVEQVKAADLTPLELTAVHRWLEFHSMVSAHHAESIKQRLEEIADKSCQTATEA